MCEERLACGGWEGRHWLYFLFVVFLWATVEAGASTPTGLGLNLIIVSPLCQSAPSQEAEPQVTWTREFNRKNYSLGEKLLMRRLKVSHRGSNWRKQPLPLRSEGTKRRVRNRSNLNYWRRRPMEMKLRPLRRASALWVLGSLSWKEWSVWVALCWQLGRWRQKKQVVLQGVCVCVCVQVHMCML